MTTVFLSGSRTLTRLNKSIRDRLSTIIDKQIAVVIGDANGADKAMQSYFAEQNYELVTVYCSGSVCRNNVGNWKVEWIKVAPNIKGRQFYTAKDLAMAQSADFGLILWDGSSSGSMANANELLRSGKSVRLYHAKRDVFYPMKSLADLDIITESIEVAKASIGESQTAELAMDGHVQIVRLPEGMRIPGAEVLVRWEGNSIVIEPVEKRSIEANADVTKSIVEEAPKATVAKRPRKKQARDVMASSEKVPATTTKRKKKAKGQESGQLAFQIE